MVDNSQKLLKAKLIQVDRVRFSSIWNFIQKSSHLLIKEIDYLGSKLQSDFCFRERGSYHLLLTINNRGTDTSVFLAQWQKSRTKLQQKLYKNECIKLKKNKFHMIQGAYDKFPDFFRMGNFIDRTRMKL